MPTRAFLTALLAVLVTTAAGLAPTTAAQAQGTLTGGMRYTIPAWFKQSFLELADDAAEAAEADRHVLLFMHLDECPYCAALLEESIAGGPYSDWLRNRFDAIAINVRGDREVVFNSELTVTEKELAEVLQVRQTPAVIFLDGQNQVVMRSDGYRTATDFKRILDYVDSKSYLSMDLASFIRRDAAGQRYTLRAHDAFQDLTDLSASAQPLMVIFEDAWCDACDLMHDTLLRDAEVNALMSKLTVVRLDAAAETPLVTPAGERTTAREWSRTLGLAARPGIVLYDGAEELVRIDGVLRRFHFQTALRYVAERHFETFPGLREYSRQHREALLESGATIDLGVQ